MGQGSGESSQLMKLTITAASELIDMGSKLIDMGSELIDMGGETEFLVQNNPEVSDRVKEVEMQEIFSQKTMIDTRQSPTITQPDELSFCSVKKEAVQSKPTRAGILGQTHL